MRAKVITVCNQKGGSGKTTISMHVAGTLAKKNKVLVIDADRQSTATRWAASADDANPFRASVVGLSAAETKVHREVQKFVDDYDYIVIDCPPAADSPVPQSALLISDLALVPVIPSPVDIWAAIGIKQIIENVASINDELKARIVINQCQPNTSLAREVIELLPEFGIEICQTELRQRVAYRQAAAFGSTVHDLGIKAQAASSEINSLVDEIVRILKK